MSSHAELTRLGAALPSWVLTMSLATGALLAAALLADRLLERRVSAAVRMLLPAAVLARLALPAGWESPLGLLGVRRPPAVSIGDPDLSLITVTPLDRVPASFGSGWLLVLYAAVVLVLLGRWLHARWSLRRRLRDAVPDGAFEGVPVVRHTELGPLVAGLRRPTIVVPAALAASGGEALQWVLRHERAHVRRRDLPAGALIQLACIFAWPVLPVWIAGRRIRVLMEMACDEQALRGADGAGRRRYGELLLALATHGRDPVPAVSFGSPLRGRLRALSSRRRWPVAVQALMVGAVAALCFACAGEPGPDEPPPVAVDAQPDVAEVGAIASSAPSASSRFRSSSTVNRPGGQRGLAGPGGAGLVFSVPPEPRRPESPASSALAPLPRRDLADGRFPPTLHVQFDGVLWLSTRRGGSLRVGDALPLERAIREALAETGSGTLLIERSWETSEAEMTRIREAARRAGAKDLAVSTPDRDRRFVKRRPTPTSPLFDPVLTISGSGAAHLNGERIAPEDLESKLRRVLASSGSETLLLRGDREAFRTSTEITAVAKRAGFRNVAVLTERQGDPTPSADGPRGTLDKAIIRRTVQSHLDEVKDCYEKYRDHEPGPAGRLVVQFTISETGAVVASRLGDSTLGAPPIENCVARAVRGWTFPRPEGGVVIVSYPFELAPAPGEHLMLPDRALIEALAGHTAEIQRDCGRYLRASLRGAVMFRWTILPSGEVSHVYAGRGMEELEACAAGKITRLPRPPAISGPLTVDHAVVFPQR